VCTQSLYIWGMAAVAGEIDIMEAVNATCPLAMIAQAATTRGRAVFGCHSISGRRSPGEYNRLWVDKASPADGAGAGQGVCRAKSSFHIYAVEWGRRGRYRLVLLMWEAVYA